MKNFNLKIVNDNTAECPLTEWDNFFSFLSCHHRYYNSDKTKNIYDNAGNRFNQNDFNSLDEIKAFLEKQKYVWVKVYMYSHSGDTISTKPFGCHWDSGVFGYLYATREQILEAFGGKRLTSELRIKARESMECFVDETWDAYISGEVYGYQILDEEDEIVDSCYGFYGEKHAIEEGESVLLALKEDDLKRTVFIQTNIAYISALEA